MTTKKKQTKQPETVVEPQPEAAPVGLQRETLLEFARLDIKKDALKKELEETTERHKVLQKQILTAFEHLGMDSVKFCGHSIYTFKQLWAKPADGVERAVVIAMLKKSGFKDYVSENFNTQSLSARFRELEKQYLEMHQQQPKEGRKPFRLVDYLPKPLVKVLNLNPDFSIRIQGTIPTEKLDQLEEEVKKDGNVQK